MRSRNRIHDGWATIGPGSGEETDTEGSAGRGEDNRDNGHNQTGGHAGLEPQDFPDFASGAWISVLHWLTVSMGACMLQVTRRRNGTSNSESDSGKKTEDICPWLRTVWGVAW